MQLEELVGQKLVVGFPGTSVTPEIVRHFQELRAGGLILYRINFESPDQLVKLVSELEEALGRRLLVTADHEGGRVVMFRDGITVFPDNLAMGRLEGTEAVEKQGRIEAKELRRLGIDVNLGPVLDVLTESYSPNIGIRSYGTDWRRVTELGLARIEAMQKGGLSACAKHFPGKGHAPVDAHLGLPVIPSTWKEMREVHLKPFAAAIEAGVDLVMTSHPHYPNLDPDHNRIATFSRKIAHDCLRQELGFRGVIASDDLEMGAIKAICPIGEAAVKTAAAGHDLLLVCHDLESQKQVFRSLVEAYRSHELSVPELEASVERVLALKAKRVRRFEGGKPHAEESGAKLAGSSAEASAALLKGKPLSKPGRTAKMAVIFPRFSELDPKIMVERALCDEPAFVSGEFEKLGLTSEVCVVGIEPTDEELVRAEALSKEADLTVLFCYDAHLYPSNRKLLEAVQVSARKSAVVLLRDFYDAEFVKSGVPCATDFGWRACQVRAALAKLFS